MIADASTTFQDPTFLEALCIQIQVVGRDGGLAHVSALLRGKISTKVLSQAAPPRSTPIVTTGLRFSVFLNAEGVRRLRITG